MPDDMVAEHRSHFEKSIEHLRTEMQSLRTGRANPQLVENVQIEAYDTRQALNAVASITVPDPQTIQIEPWDKSIVKNIEKGILEADIGFNPNVAGTVIRLAMPPLTEEGRLKMKKILGEKLELARVHVRQVRDDVRNAIKSSEEAGEISEDEKYRMLEDLDKVAAQYNEKIKAMGEEKEKEIMTV